MNPSLAVLTVGTRLAQLDLKWARRAAELGQATNRELEAASTAREAALDLHELTWAEQRLNAARRDFAPQIAAGLRLGGWAAVSARALRAAIAAGQVSSLDSLAARLRRDLAASSIPG